MTRQVDIKEVVELLEQGHSFNSIGRKLGLHKNTVSNHYRREFGEEAYKETVKRTNTTKGKYRQVDLDMDKVQKLLDEGHSFPVVAETLNCSATTVRNKYKQSFGLEEYTKQAANARPGPKTKPNPNPNPVKSEPQDAIDQISKWKEEKYKFDKNAIATTKELEEEEKDFKKLGNPKLTLASGARRRRRSKEEMKRDEAKRKGYVDTTNWTLEDHERLEQELRGKATVFI